jgi:hypothetical protein
MAKLELLNMIIVMEFWGFQKILIYRDIVFYLFVGVIFNINY